MSLFASCLVNKKDSSTQYSQEEAYSKTCFSCCLGFKTRGNRTGVIRLMNTMDDYLNQPSPVSIEALLAEQEEELDQYYDQTDDEDSFHGPSIHAKTKGSFYEDDAESLSEHRISAILDDGPVMNAGGRVFAIKPRQEEETIVCQMETHASQELVQLDTIPTPFKQYTFPATHLTKASYSPSPPMLIHHDTRQDSIPQPIPSLSNTSSLDKSSVVAAAQSLLGDKLDDFTEKLALIKKNIISSVEDDPQGSMSRPKSESL
ncbi:uncharacterized protein B0P05DRAFT_551137, partial [Gilbertella persicaria]|uniref:uncharacterized protein n=1 Tax=Gilbertella persicaria TaxID=101096 RepID=UPI00221F9034